MNKMHPKRALPSFRARLTASLSPIHLMLFHLSLPIMLSACGQANPFAEPERKERGESVSTEEGLGETETASADADTDVLHEDAIGIDIDEADALEAEMEDAIADGDAPASEPGPVQAQAMPLTGCEYRSVVNTNGSRLLVSDAPGSTFNITARLHPGDQVKVISQGNGRLVKDSALGRQSSQWFQITYPYGAGFKTGWINELYATCLTECPYVEVQHVGTQSLLVKSTPYPGGSVVHRFYGNHIARAVEAVTDGILIADSALNASSRTWHKVEYYDGTSGLEKQGWVSSVYTFCTHGRMNSSDGKLKLPVPSRMLTSTESDHKRRGSVNAWDINAAFGTPIRPIAPGKVVYVGCNNAGGYGCWTYIAHDNGMYSIMAHMITGSQQVTTGQRVSQDTVVGRVGWTGFTTFGPHVHLEIISGGTKVLVGNFFDNASMAYCLFCSLKK